MLVHAYIPPHIMLTAGYLESHRGGSVLPEAASPAPAAVRFAFLLLLFWVSFHVPSPTLAEALVAAEPGT